MSEISGSGLGRILLAVVASWGLLSAAPAGAKLYQCVGANGKLAFQDRPCAAGEQTTEIESVTPKREQPPAVAITPEVQLQLPGQDGGGVGMGYRIDTTEVNSKAWVDAMAQAGQAPPLRAGTGQMTLLRVLLEGDKSADVQLTATKLVKPGTRGGGGTYRQLSHGDFVLIEHIASTSRRKGRDLLKVGTVAHGVSEIRVPVPSKGILGVFGDVILSEASVAEKGVLKATIATTGVPGVSTNLSMRLGPIAVGGPYGYSIPFYMGDRSGRNDRPSPGDRSGKNDRSDIGGQTQRIVLAPGTYKIAMLDFDTVKSRFTVEVEPGELVKVHFEAKSPQVVEMLRTDREPVPASTGH
jgi:hypothetical protein